MRVSVEDGIHLEVEKQHESLGVETYHGKKEPD